MTLTREVELAATLGFGFDDVDMLLMAGFRRDAREGSMQVLRDNLWGRRHEGEWVLMCRPHSTVPGGGSTVLKFSNRFK
jgi:hypothetical protein